MHEFKRMLTLFNSKEKELVLVSKSLEWFALETLRKDERNESFFSSVGEEDEYILRFWVQMTLLPSLLQPIHSNGITQSKGQKCPSTSKKMTKSKSWHENQNIT